MSIFTHSIQVRFISINATLSSLFLISLFILNLDGSFPVDVEHPNKAIGDVASFLMRQTSAVLPQESAHFGITHATGFAPGEILCSNGYVSHVEKTSEFYIQLKPNEVDKLMEFIDALALRPEFVNDLSCAPSIGKSCLAYFADDQRHYRAIVKTIAAESITVFYVDYGNSSTLPFTAVHTLPADLAQQPALAVKCALDGVNLTTKEADDFFADLVLDLEVTAKCVKVEGDVVFVRLLDDAGNDLNQKIIELGQAAPLEEKPTSEEASSTATTLSTSHRLSLAPDEMLCNQGFISHASSISEFFIQPDSNGVDVLMDKIDALALRPDFMNDASFVPAVGKFCLSFFPLDGRFYRAMVVKVEEESITVLYIDYGNTSTLKITDLKPLPSDLAQQPALAVKCALDGISPTTKEADDFFIDLVSDLDVTAKCVKVAEDRVYVRLFDAAGHDLNQKILEQIHRLQMEKHSDTTEASSPLTPIIVPEVNQFGAPEVDQFGAPESPALSVQPPVEPVEEPSTIDQESDAQHDVNSSSLECGRVLETICEEQFEKVADQLPAASFDWTLGETMSSSACVTHVSPSTNECWLQVCAYSFIIIS